MKKWKDNRGVIMVEASIYFPIAIFTVFAMIYYGMMKYQESILAFEVQKMATIGAREAAYPGYELFAEDGSLLSAAVDFKPGTDFNSKVADYYAAYSEQLYDEWKFSFDEYEGNIAGDLEELMNQKTFLSGIETNATVNIKSNVISRTITVEATYGLDTPKFLNYIGVPLDLKLKTVTVQSASNPVDIVRNTDLAIDLIDFLLEQLGLKDNVQAFLQKVEDIKNKIL